MSLWQYGSVLLWILAPAAGAAPREVSQDSLAQDPRLDMKLSVAEKDRPLGEILPALGREIHVPLRASGHAADDKATLFLDERPAAEVLAQIARQFDLRWYREGEGYELVQTLDARRREQALREQELQAQLSAVQAEMERRPSLPATPRPQLEAREAALAQRLRSEDTEADEPHRLSEHRSASTE